MKKKLLLMRSLKKNCASALRFVSDDIYIKIIYFIKMRKKLNLECPKTFNEKLQWLKLYDRQEIYTTMVDKRLVKEYIANIIGEEYIIPTIEVWEDFDRINFDFLPEKFVLKCTHDSGGVVICKDKNTFDIDFAKKKIEKSLDKNFYYYGREWPYKNVSPKIIAEKYLEDDEGDLKDYKFICFNGKCKCFKIDFDRFINHGANYYDENGNMLLFGEVICPPQYEKKLEIPSDYKKMIQLSEKIAKGIPFIRVDFYYVNGNIYFGELTFYPQSGVGLFVPEEWDEILGDWLTLPLTKEVIK